MSALGERSVRIREVEGSNPFGSTMKADLFRQVCFSYASMQTFVLSFARNRQNRQRLDRHGTIVVGSCETFHHYNVQGVK